MYRVLAASANASSVVELRKATATIPGVVLMNGDYATIMKRVVLNLELALTYAANPTQQAMLRSYIDR